MKKFSLFALAAAGMLFGACADKDAVQDVQAPAGEFEDGAFIGVSLQLPSAENTTRANDDLNNGTADEFEVKNATLYIFKLAKASTDNPDVAATYVDKVTLGTSYTADDQPAGSGNHEIQNPAIGTKITSTYNEATLIPNLLASQMKTDAVNNYYAYVIVNHNGQVAAPTTATTFKQFSDQQFTKIGADIAAVKNIHDSGLLMTNAPICNYPGGSAAPTKGSNTDDPVVTYSTLVKIDNTKIFGSKAEAEASPAGCVYIERAAVKITVEDNRSNKKIGEYDLSIKGWQVINNEPSYYNTRHINMLNNAGDAEDWGPYFNESVTTANNKYRFVSKYEFNPTLPSTTDHTLGYRTYFAKDVQYSANATLANTVASDDRPWITLKDASDNWNHAYTTENTFDVARQTWRNTTMVTIKAELSQTEGGTKTAASFYTVGKGSQTMLATAAEAKAAIENIIKGDNDVAKALNDLATKISENNTNQTVVPSLEVEFTEPTAGKTDISFSVTPDFTLAGSAYTAFSGTGEDGLKTTLINAINKVIDGDDTTAGIQTADAVLLSYYKDGLSYYNVRIKHFGDAETPWSPTLSAALEATTAGDGYITGGGANVNEIYGIGLTTDKSAQRFLGRYGVVRDNWYKLSVDKIGKIGTAEPVDPSVVTPDTPDDEVENYISVHVHIVPWVLRSQSVEF